MTHTTDQRERIAYALKSISDNCPFAYLERYGIAPSVNHQNNIKRVCFDVEQMLEAALTAAPPVPQEAIRLIKRTRDTPRKYPVVREMLDRALTLLTQEVG
jgi:hypothetical protein